MHDTESEQQPVVSGPADAGRPPPAGAPVDPQPDPVGQANRERAERAADLAVAEVREVGRMLRWIVALFLGGFIGLFFALTSANRAEVAASEQRTREAIAASEQRTREDIEGILSTIMALSDQNSDALPLPRN